MSLATDLGLTHGRAQMRLLLYFAIVTRLTTASYLRGVAPRSAGGLLFRNTTQATSPTTTEIVSLNSLEEPSSATDGSPKSLFTFSRDQITSLVNPGSSSTLAAVPTPYDASPSPSSSSPSSPSPSSSSPSSPSPSSLSPSSVRSVESMNSDFSTIGTGRAGLTSNSAVEPTNSVDVITSKTGPNAESSLAEFTRIEVTASTPHPSSTHSERETSAGLASTHELEPSQFSSTEFPFVSSMPPLVYSTSLTSVSPSTPRTKESIGATTPPDSTLLRITHSQNVLSSLPHSPGIVYTSPPPLTATMATLSALTPKPQTAIHAAAINSTVQGSQITTLFHSPSRNQVHKNAAEDTTAISTATSQIIRGDSASHMSTASAITLPNGGASPTTILTDVASQTSFSGQIQASGTGLPRVILPGSSNSPPADSSVIQLGFLSPLNYVFVSQHLQAAAQIFQILPVALAKGAVQRSSIEVTKLVPYDRLATTGYIATIAKLYYPKALVDQLQRDIINPNSDIYTKGADIERNLTALIDQAIKITDDDGGIGCASTSCDTDSAETASSSKGKGIAAGAVLGGATFCGLLGLGLFQLYRRRGASRAVSWPFRKQRRGRLDGTRISRPIDPVNSLGWNWLTPR